MPFIKDGFEAGDRAFHVVDPKHRPDHLKRLEREGIDVADAEATGRLEVRRWQEAYIKDDHFDQYRMIATIKKALDPAKKQPGKLTRLVANMEWALEDLPGVHDIVEYETRLNHVLPEYHDPVECVALGTAAEQLRPLGELHAARALAKLLKTRGFRGIVATEALEAETRA
jgi:hypothetical protein